MAFRTVSSISVYEDGNRLARLGEIRNIYSEAKEHMARWAMSIWLNGQRAYGSMGNEHMAR